MQTKKEEGATGGSAVATPAADETGSSQSSKSPDSPYTSSYRGEESWFLAVARDPERKVLPADNVTVGGVCFHSASSSPQVVEEDWSDGEEGGGLYLQAGPRQPGGFVDLTFDQVQRIRDAVRRRRVKWLGRGAPAKGGRPKLRAQIYDALSVVYRYKDGEGTPTRLRRRPDPGDVPLAEYLVMVPRKMLERFGGREGPLEGRMPRMAELDEELSELPPPETVLNA